MPTTSMKSKELWMPAMVRGGELCGIFKFLMAHSSLLPIENYEIYFLTGNSGVVTLYKQYGLRVVRSNNRSKHVKVKQKPHSSQY